MYIENLSKLYNETIALLEPSKVSYFHLKSVKNFISNLNKIDEISLQDEIENTLTKYLNEVKRQKDSGKMIMVDRIDFFNEYIYPVAKIYEKKLGFSVRIKPWIFLGWVVMGNAIGFIIGNYIWLYVVINIIIFGYYIQSMIYWSKGLVYGFDY